MRRAASAAAEQPRLANFDARAAEAARGSAAVRAPAFQWASPASKASARLAVGAPKNAVEAARRFLGLSSGTASARAAITGPVDETVVEGVHDTGRGAVVVQLKRQVGGLDVFGERTAVALNRQLEPVARTGAAVSAARSAPALRSFALDPTAAIAAALADLTGEAYGAGDLVTAEPRAGYLRADLAPATAAARAERLAAPARARALLFRLAGQLVPAYQVEVALRRTGSPLQAFAYVVSAVDGAVLMRRNQVQQDFTYQVWADPVGLLPDDGPQGPAGTPHPTGIPDGYQAEPIAQSSVTLQNFPFSHNDPWLPAGADSTVGNNVAAYADWDLPDGYAASSGDVMGEVSTPGTFAWTYDFAAEPYEPMAQVQAAITQLFYDNNVFHDWYYDSGFDEASGNAQQDNLGRGGVAGDPLLAEAQDFSGTDNANMWTPADGQSPVMQMYLFYGNGQHYVEVTAPAAIADKYEALTFPFGPSSFDLGGQVVAIAPADGCTPITNGADIAGKVALIDRGNCNFTVKVKAAQESGAMGVIIRNVTPSQSFANVGGEDSTITIPTLLVALDTGAALGAQLEAGVTARLYREAVLMRDGTVDNLIVAHEWGHYISNRLVGNGSGLEALQAGGLGEGWGDTHAMLLAVRQEDAQVAANADFGGTYGLSGWVDGGEAALGGGNQGYYFGIRRVPYSTDMSKDPLTFRHIADGEPLVPADSTIPIAFGADGAENSEVHNTGEVWATMLWECYASLLRDTLGDSPRLTFDQARSRWKDYLVAAYKLTPENPTILEARDALLAAAYATDHRDYTLFWQAFAKRGAGVGAVGPDKWLSLDNNPVVESYQSDPHFTVVNATFTSGAGSCTDGDTILDAGERGTLTVQLRNDGVTALAASKATPSARYTFSFPGGAVDVPASAQGEAVTVTVPVSMSARSPASDSSFVLTFPETSETAGFTVDVPVVLNRDLAPASSATESFAEPELPWMVDGTFGDQPGWKREGRAMRAAGTDGTSDLRLVSPDLAVGDGDFTLFFRHRYMFEMDSAFNQFDGGVIELSDDGGGTWVDIGESVYDGEVSAGGTNPLAGRPAFTYVNWSFPEFDTVLIDLGTAHAGKTVKIRFRAGSDEAVGWGGWTVNWVAFGGLTNTPFATLSADAGTCANLNASSSPSGGGCATGGGALGGAALLAFAALALRLRRRRAR